MKIDIRIDSKLTVLIDGRVTIDASITNLALRQTGLLLVGCGAFPKNDDVKLTITCLTKTRKGRKALVQLVGFCEACRYVV